MSFDVLLEDGTALLVESSDHLLLEAVAVTATTTPGGGNKAAKDGPSPETAAYWESERERLAILRDDDEVMLLL